jgi:hypothetical protein
MMLDLLAAHCKFARHIFVWPMVLLARRINAVSPGVLLESMPVYGEYFRGHEPVPGERVANAYVKSLEGRLTGQVFSVL